MLKELGCLFYFSIFLGSIIDIHVLFGIERVIALPATVCMASILNSTSNAERIHFHFVGENLYRKDYERMVSLMNYFRPFTMKWEPFNLVKLEKFDTLRFNKKVLLKLFVGEIFPSRISRAMYLDCDTLVLRNIRDLFEMDMTDKYVAGLDLCSRGKVCYTMLHCSHLFFNGGVMVFNLDLMRKDNLQRRFLRFVRKNVRAWGGLDEFTISKVVGKERSIQLPGRYNDMYISVGCNAAEYQDTVIVHYCGRNNKPWLPKHRGVLPRYLEMYWPFLKLVKSLVFNKNFGIKKRHHRFPPPVKSYRKKRNESFKRKAAFAAIAKSYRSRKRVKNERKKKNQRIVAKIEKKQ